ncbi:hypothetical protein PLICBS_000079 [Purpureocillium lilacinum]|uniref:uncharacterized protein n=1 Tax=Purpureocillium lilacinum TaxID=33203 RepID=UPI0020857553|nr:hypothetical protein PLICBS_000079 [Purpureocillium lilacinum]
MNLKSFLTLVALAAAGSRAVEDSCNKGPSCLQEQEIAARCMSEYISTKKGAPDRVRYASCLWKEAAFREAQNKCIECKKEITVFNAGEALFHQTSQKKVRDDFLDKFESTADKTDIWTRYLALESTKEWQGHWQNWTSKYDTDAKIKARLEELQKTYPSTDGEPAATPKTAIEILHPGSTVKQSMEANGTVFVVQCLEFKHIIISETIIVKTSVVKIDNGLRKATDEERVKMPEIPQDTPTMASLELSKALRQAESLTKVAVANDSGEKLLQEVRDGEISKTDANQKIESTDALKLEVSQVVKISTVAGSKSQLQGGSRACHAHRSSSKRHVVRRR